MADMPVHYRLAPHSPGRSQPPTLDAAQRTVVEHPGGPLLVLAGPGTGKTTTLVEAVVDRVAGRGLDPNAVLVLTFGRKAAEELRSRITARLGRTTGAPMASTFHSFAYGLIRRYGAGAGYADLPRLLTAAEQDTRLAELLAHSAETGRATWPAVLAAALPTRGFAREVHAVLARARELGLEPAELADIGHRAGRPEWVAAGGFMSEYLEVLGLQRLVDYAELLSRAVDLAETPEIEAELRSTYRAVFVDEYQDTDPSQVRLLQALAGDGRDLVVVGDPDQSIYAFRGAEVRGILEFPRAFPRRDGAPADVRALQTTRRFGTGLLVVSRRVAAGIGTSGDIPPDEFRRFRHPEAATDRGPGRAEVLVLSSAGNEVAHIADLIRRAHLEDGLPWSSIAVLVRSGVLSIPPLRRGLVAAGVPVEVAGDEVPLRLEPAVRPLLLALRVAAGLEVLDDEVAEALLLSPLGGLDAPSLRRLGRELRRQDRDAASAGDGHPATRPSRALVAAALADPVLLADLDGPGARRMRRLGELLLEVAAQLARGATAEEGLWALWSGTIWPRQLRAAIERGGSAARSAHRDLDAVCALFESAAREEERANHTSASVFLDELAAQQIPADTLAERGVRGEAVRLLTAHRAKGLEWELVVVAGVQEGRWPDLRRRGSVLQADRLGRDGLLDAVPTSRLLAEERRLFYVAVTRARERLVVTAVASPEADGDQPSLLVHDLGIAPSVRPGRPDRPMSLPGLVAELRRVAADPASSGPLRAAAAARLARLAAEPAGGGGPLAPAAHPGSWWGLRARTEAPEPIFELDQELSLSASLLSSLANCPLRWFLEKRAGGVAEQEPRLGFGSILHALADHAAHLMAERGAVERDDLIRWLDSVWPALGFPADWVAGRERVEAEACIDRLLAWMASSVAAGGRTPIATEIPFRCSLRLPSGEPVRLEGRVDRMESDPAGRALIVDFKTGKHALSKDKAAVDPQLGLYQLVADLGVFDTIDPGSRLDTEGAPGRPLTAGGAELVYLRCAGPGGLPQVRRQEAPDADPTGRRTVEQALASAVAMLRGEEFPALRNSGCNHCDFRRMCPVGQPSGPVL